MSTKPLPHLSEKDIQRFHSKYDTIEPLFCWEWKDTPTEWGYGTFKAGNRKLKSHRVAYFLHYGVDPGELLVCHACDNPLCVNPFHLFLGTDETNNADMVSKGRNRWLIGQSHPNAKLTDEQIREIHDKVSLGAKYRDLAIEYGVSFGLIGHIMKGRNWTHIK